MRHARGAPLRANVPGSLHDSRGAAALRN
jgi:hypothetical protein